MRAGPLLQNLGSNLVLAQAYDFAYILCVTMPKLGSYNSNRFQMTNIPRMYSLSLSLAVGLAGSADRDHRNPPRSSGDGLLGIWLHMISHLVFQLDTDCLRFPARTVRNR
jgi:hypothetical protein